MEKNCFQKAQNYTFWLVLEKAYREKNVINFALAFIKIVRRRTLLIYPTVVGTVVHFFTVSTVWKKLKIFMEHHEGAIQQLILLWP